MCNITAIKNYSFSGYGDIIEIAAFIFWADGCLCILFAFLTHFKYTSVKVLNHRVSTVATSNLHWIWFFIFTALSSISSGLNLWFNCTNMEHKEFLIITADWFASLLSIFSLALAVKYQWKHREQAYHRMAGTSADETTPILLEQNGINSFRRPSKADLFFLALLLLSAVFFAVAWSTEDNVYYYWLAHGFLWFLQVIIFIMIIVMCCTITEQGPSVETKCILLTGVVLNALSDIPAFIWFSCVFGKSRNSLQAGVSYDVLVSLILLSHIAFSFVVRAEFLRLKDVVIWRLTGQIDNLEESVENVQGQ